MAAPKQIVIKLDDKPNLTRLMHEDNEAFREVLQTCIALAEEAADAERKVPWYRLPGEINSNMSFSTMLPAIVRAFFNVNEISPDDFDFMGVAIHPMSMFKGDGENHSKLYPSWRKHFDFPEDEPLNEETITKALRKLYYYARYMSILDYSEAFMNNRSVLYKDIPLVAMESLPFLPAIRYQKEHVHEDYITGKMWDDVGAFKGGTVKAEDIASGECLACKVGKLQETYGYHVCTHCNIGFKVEGDAYESVNDVT